MVRSAAEIRQRNTFDVIRASRSPEGASRREIAESTGLSFTTVANICTTFLQRGLLTEVGRERTVVGRPTARLSLNATHGHLLGVDIAETYVHVETFDAALNVTSSTELEIDEYDRSPHKVVSRIRDAIEREIAGAPGGSRILGVGVSAPGQVDQVGGTSVFAPNWDWHNVPLLEMLADIVDAPLYLDNPLKSLAIAELWSNPARQSQDFVVLNLGTGVGAGIAIDGRLFRGRTNSAGEWGHTVIVADGRACRCGSRGCVEAYVGAPGIIQSLRELAPASPLLHGEDQTHTIAAITAGLASGHPDAIAVTDRTGHYLGIAIATMVNILNPEVVVIGGWVSGALGDHLLDRARVHVRAHALATPMVATRLEVQQPHGNSVSLGSAAFALEGYVNSVADSLADSSSAAT